MSISAFELGDLDHSDLFGAFLAVHALPGSVMFLHATVGCKFKTQMHLAEHDWRRESNYDRIWTGVEDLQLIAGSGPALVETVMLWY